MLEQQYVDELACSPSTLSTSPLGSLSDTNVRRLFIDLISTMNASFHDHDFSSLSPDHFQKEPHIERVMTSINMKLAELAEAYNSNFLEDMWISIEDVVHLRECEVYSYAPDMEEDPFSEGNLWTFNYFFFNKNLKRILYFTCIARSQKSLIGDHFMDNDMVDSSDERGDDYMMGEWEEEI